MILSPQLLIYTFISTYYDTATTDLVQEKFCFLLYQTLRF